MLMRKRKIVIGLISALLLLTISPADSKDAWYVADEATAIAIARAVLRPIVGAQSVDNPTALPFYANLIKRGVGLTGGDLFCYVENAPPARLKWTTPVLRVEMNQKSAQIISISDGKNNVWKIMTDAEKNVAKSTPIVVEKIAPSGTHYQVLNPILHDVSDKGFVPDNDTAIAVAKAVLRPLVGDEAVDRPLCPYHATLDAKSKAVWFVENQSPARDKIAAPVISVEIERISGRIIRTHLVK